MVVNAEGQQRTAIVGRVKIETRPLVRANTVQQQNRRGLTLQLSDAL